MKGFPNDTLDLYSKFDIFLILRFGISNFPVPILRKTNLYKQVHRLLYHIGFKVLELFLVIFMVFYIDCVSFSNIYTSQLLLAMFKTTKSSLGSFHNKESRNVPKMLISLKMT